jgi:peptide/nickel transport system permease protein
LHQYADSLETSAGHVEDIVGRDLDSVLLPDDEQRDYYGSRLDETDTLTAEDAQAVLDDEPGLVEEPYGRHLRQTGDFDAEGYEYAQAPGFPDDGSRVVGRAADFDQDGWAGGFADAALAGGAAFVDDTAFVAPAPGAVETLVMDDSAGNSVENAIELREVAGLSQSRIVFRRFLRHRGAMVALAVLIGVILLAATSIGWGPIPGWYPWTHTSMPPIANPGGRPTMYLSALGDAGSPVIWYLLAALIGLALLAAAIAALMSVFVSKEETAAQLRSADDEEWVGYHAPLTPRADRLHNLARAIFRWGLLAAALAGLAYLFTHLHFGSHPFGQDNIGRDGFARVMRGTQQSLTIMVIIGALATLIGVIFGSISGYFRGHVDNVIMRFTDMVIAIPTIVLGAILGVMVGGASPALLAFALSFMVWTGMARLVRAQFLALREQEFVDAARVAGASHFRIMFKHILPNAVGIIIVNSTLLMASAILLETSLSFLGFGITSPDVSLGQIINEYQAAFTTRPWLFWWPGLFIVTIALCVNFIGDGLRDAFDPRQRRIPTARALARADARKAAKVARGIVGRPAAPPTTAIPVVTAIPEHLDV